MKSAVAKRAKCHAKTVSLPTVFAVFWLLFIICVVPKVFALHVNEPYPPIIIGIMSKNVNV